MSLCNHQYRIVSFTKINGLEVASEEVISHHLHEVYITKEGFFKSKESYERNEELRHWVSEKKKEWNCQSAKMICGLCGATQQYAIEGVLSALGSIPHQLTENSVSEELITNSDFSPSPSAPCNAKDHNFSLGGNYTVMAIKSSRLLISGNDNNIVAQLIPKLKTNGNDQSISIRAPLMTCTRCHCTTHALADPKRRKELGSLVVKQAYPELSQQFQKCLSLD